MEQGIGIRHYRIILINLKSIFDLIRINFTSNYSELLIFTNIKYIRDIFIIYLLRRFQIKPSTISDGIISPPHTRRQRV